MIIDFAEMGTEDFKQKDYMDASHYYTKAIQLADVMGQLASKEQVTRVEMISLHNNRARSYMKVSVAVCLSKMNQLCII
jgi:hypothetical protein